MAHEIFTFPFDRNPEFREIRRSAVESLRAVAQNVITILQHALMQAETLEKSKLYSQKKFNAYLANKSKSSGVLTLFFSKKTPTDEVKLFEEILSFLAKVQEEFDLCSLHLETIRGTLGGISENIVILQCAEDVQDVLKSFKNTPPQNSNAILSFIKKWQLKLNSSLQPNSQETNRRLYGLKHAQLAKVQKWLSDYYGQENAFKAMEDIRKTAEKLDAQVNSTIALLLEQEIEFEYNKFSEIPKPEARGDVREGIEDDQIQIVISNERLTYPLTSCEGFLANFQENAEGMPKKRFHPNIDAESVKALIDNLILKYQAQIQENFETFKAIKSKCYEQGLGKS